jgi:hypothetical protein
MRTVLARQTEAWSAVRTLQNAANAAIRARLDVRPLTLSLSPEYEGEGTGVGADGAAKSRRFVVDQWNIESVFC